MSSYRDVRYNSIYSTYTTLSDYDVEFIIHNVKKYYPFENGEFIHIVDEYDIMIYKPDDKSIGIIMSDDTFSRLSRRIDTKELMRQIKLDSLDI